MEYNFYFYTLLVITLALFLLDFFADFLNMKSLDDKLPSEFREVVDEKSYSKSQQYNKSRTRFSLLTQSFSLIVFLAFWLSGSFNTLDTFLCQWGWGEIPLGLAFFVCLMGGNYILSLPAQIYSTFVIEEKYGFNKSTPRTFLADQLKAFLLGALLGLPILYALLWFFSLSNAWSWAYAWAGMTAFSLLLSYVAPQWIMPLFNKFSPLEEGSLSEKIRQMAQLCDFPLAEVSIMDGSKRSTKSNAFFTGFGKNKRIALFDTLVEKHSEEELLAVLAHEIGHYKLKHILKNMLFGILQTGVYFYLIHLFVLSTPLQKAFGMEVTSVHAGLIFFAVLFKPVSKILSFYASHTSRVYEYEADAYAAKHTGNTEDLISALMKLSKDNLSHFTPHPFYVWMNYSHPPVLKRIYALRNIN